MSSAVGVSPDGPERRNDLRATEVAHEAVMRWVNSSTDVRRHVGTEVVAALAAADYVLVQLPEQCRIPTWWHEECLGAWESTRGDPISAWPSNERGVALPEAQFISIGDAQTLAAALLAASLAASLAVAGLPVGEEAEK